MIIWETQLIYCSTFNLAPVCYIQLTVSTQPALSRTNEVCIQTWPCHSLAIQMNIIFSFHLFLSSKNLLHNNEKVCSLFMMKQEETPEALLSRASCIKLKLPRIFFFFLSQRIFFFYFNKIYFTYNATLLFLHYVVIIILCLLACFYDV